MSKFARRSFLLISAVAIAAIALPVFRSWQHAQSRQTCKQNLKSLGLALHAYHDGNDCFPSAYSPGELQHSWRLTLLPDLGRPDLFRLYQMDSAWNSSQNIPLLAQRPPQYACPEVNGGTNTSYKAVVGLNTAWPYDSATRMIDFKDGTSNTIQVLDVHDHTSPWTQPDELTFNRAVDAIAAGQAHGRVNDTKLTQILLADGSVRAISSRVDPETVRALLSPANGRSLPPERLSAATAAMLSQAYGADAEFSDPVSVSALPATTMSVTDDVEITDGHSTVYCPTMILALRRFTAGNGGLFNEFGRHLIASPFLEDHIDPMSIAIESGRTANGGSIVTCRLTKGLAFASQFEPFREPLAFNDSTGEHHVRSFGITSHWEEWQYALQQVYVVDYRSPDDFIIKLDNLSGDDLILAKIPRHDTLRSCIDQVTQRIADTRLPANHRRAVAGEQLVVPVLEFSLFDQFADKLGYVGDLELISAKQIIQFRLDERGAVLKSEAQVIGENGHYEYQLGNRSFLFDKPFLLMLRESPDKQPYFAAWLGNTDVMQPAF